MIQPANILVSNYFQLKIKLSSVKNVITFHIELARKLEEELKPNVSSFRNGDSDDYRLPYG